MPTPDASPGPGRPRTGSSITPSGASAPPRARPPRAIRVVVADDDPIVCSSVGKVLAEQPGMTLVGIAADGAQAVALVRQQHVDIVVIDIQMPRINGIEATRQIFHASPRTKVLLLTTFDKNEFLTEGLMTGVSGFLVKTTNPFEVVEAVRAVARGGKVMSPEPTRRLVDHMIQEHALPSSHPHGAGAGLGVDLSSREQEVLALLAQALSNHEIAQEIGIAETTVKTHVSTLMRKLGASNRVGIVVKAFHLGLAKKAP